jgi:hypothetical protein
MNTIEIVNHNELHEKLGFKEPLFYPWDISSKSLKEWRMEVDDAPILRYLYRNFRPRRHLEFGTWQGFGATLCLEECDATVWTINLPFGESKDHQENVYSNYPSETSALQRWAERVGLPEKPFYRTDQLGFIGRHYLGRHFGHRVCQIYAHSSEWDISNYPEYFFDSCLVDGGHERDIILNDTRKALSLLRQDGMIMWHDFSLDSDLISASQVVHNVADTITKNIDYLHIHLKKIFFINPSMLLIGIKK